MTVSELYEKMSITKGGRFPLTYIRLRERAILEIQKDFFFVGIYRCGQALLKLDIVQREKRNDLLQEVGTTAGLSNICVELPKVFSKNFGVPDILFVVPSGRIPLIVTIEILDVRVPWISLSCHFVKGRLYSRIQPLHCPHGIWTKSHPSTYLAETLRPLIDCE